MNVFSCATLSSLSDHKLYVSLCYVIEVGLVIKTRGPWATSLTGETIPSINIFAQSFDYTLTLIKREKLFLSFLELNVPLCVGT